MQRMATKNVSLQVIGWSISDEMTIQETVSTALNMAKHNRNITKWMIFISIEECNMLALISA